MPEGKKKNQQNEEDINRELEESSDSALKDLPEELTKIIEE
jgi:hypothetical protein